MNKISHKELKARFRELFETLELEKEKEREFHSFYIDENGKVRHTDENLDENARKN